MILAQTHVCLRKDANAIRLEFLWQFCKDSENGCILHFRHCGAYHTDDSTGVAVRNVFLDEFLREKREIWPPQRFQLDQACSTRVMTKNQ